MSGPVEVADEMATQPSLGSDVLRLNAGLGSEFSFHLRRVSAPARRRAGGLRERRRLTPTQAAGVLTVATTRSTRESAAFPVRMGGRRRERLLALARCLAECAMDLGMGTAIYKKGRERSGDSRWATLEARPHP